ncbi:MAG: erythromycin esterase family protein [Gammaproteobacteria bacterium]|jgi:protein-L-isoaspartate(D-aspartate) O-methyltransferase|nr:erythromycin esterase family protein [Gammaproteobacteria bacterium]MBT3722952.1 erythromycin esterase family protein [Gammaproteobacteria bacterium]MBT4077415.1 erythromycin esterase family protein [Gammaproteobacteria bacterium]MBT4193390.1 erythromycin esterase family protein [Gammaproteobacteria bacterium]MBT4449069.1 erythromycin esterase family protein [Gammaproteobacteria bacterium]
MYKKPSTLFWLLIFLPLITTAQWQDETSKQTGPSLPELIYNSTEHFTNIDSVNLDGLLQRIGDSRLVLLGEASHGSAEFYDMRARITRELIEKKGFNIIAIEGDWPDVESIDHFIRGSDHDPILNNDFSSTPGFSRFPRWMWMNHSVSSFVQWLKDHNQSINSAENTAGFYGLDIYNMVGSIEAVLNYLQGVDPQMAEVARWSYACLKPRIADPSHYSRVMQSGRFRGCEYEVLSVLQNLLQKQEFYSYLDGHQFFNALQNARLVMSAERYYRTLYHTGSKSWNQRDQHMFDTLLEVLNFRGQKSKAIIWAHNLHVGDARATKMSAHGDFNLGQRVRETFGDNAYLIGFGTHHGTVAAASRWGGSVEVMQVPPSGSDSYGHLFHGVDADNFLLPLRNPVLDITRKKLLAKRLQRSIGVVYDPETELKKNYAYSSLPRQFDEYIWFNETQAVKPLKR